MYVPGRHIFLRSLFNTDFQWNNYIVKDPRLIFIIEKQVLFMSLHAQMSGGVTLSLNDNNIYRKRNFISRT